MVFQIRGISRKVYQIIRGLCNTNCGKDMQLVVSSLRVDNVAATGLGLSRRNTDLSFLSRLLFLNGNVLVKKSTQIKAGDVIDRVRQEESNHKTIQFDSLRILEIGSKTAKGKHRISVTRTKAISLTLQEFQDRSAE